VVEPPDEPPKWLHPYPEPRGLPVSEKGYTLQRRVSVPLWDIPVGITPCQVLGTPCRPILPGDMGTGDTTRTLPWLECELLADLCADTRTPGVETEGVRCTPGVETEGVRCTPPRGEPATPRISIGGPYTTYGPDLRLPGLEESGLLLPVLKAASERLLENESGRLPPAWLGILLSAREA